MKKRKEIIKKIFKPTLFIIFYFIFFSIITNDVFAITCTGTCNTWSKCRPDKTRTCIGENFSPKGCEENKNNKILKTQDEDCVYVPPTTQTKGGVEIGEKENTKKKDEISTKEREKKNVTTGKAPKYLFEGVCNGIDCDFAALARLINNFINWFIYISVLIAACTFSYAGFNILTNQQKPEELLKWKGVLRKTVIGMIVVLLAWLIVYTIVKSLVTSDPNSTLHFLGGLKSK